LTSMVDVDRPPVPVEPPKAFVDVRDLVVKFPTDDGVVQAVDGLSYTVERGRTLGIVGESGSGKSVSSLALLGLYRKTTAQVTGQIWVDGTDLLTISMEAMRRLRGNEIAMIFQDPLSALHPFYTVGDQIVEAYRVHNDVSKTAAKARTVEMLDRVGIPNPDKRADDYPHQFSGGMRQRAMIAMALVCNPALLIADEPTTALDVTVQAQILELIKDLQREFNSAVIMITHDLGVIAETADDVVVMYGGRCVESGSVRDIFYRPQMPYTWGLLSSMPRLDKVRKERLRPIAGTPPSLINLPKGCVFAPRCTFTDRVDPNTSGGGCFHSRPELVQVGPGHHARCFLDDETRDSIWTNEIKPAL
jgi:peptide/nickel transport system ATP-binding protein